MTAPETPDPLSESVPVAIPAPIRKGRLAAVALIFAFLAGAFGWGAGEEIVKDYHDRIFPKLKPVPELAEIKRVNDARIESALMAFAMFGSIMGAASGLAGGIAASSTKNGARGGLVGMVLGGALSAGASAVMLPLFFARHDPQVNSLTFPLLTHGVVWSTMGAVSGLALGIGIGGGRWKQACGGGFAGAILATLAYELIGAMAFPTDRTELPIPASLITRALGPFLVAFLSFGGAVLMIGQPDKKAKMPDPF